MKMDIFYKDKMPELHLEWEVVKGKTLVKEDFSMSELWLFLTSENGMRWISANIEDNVIKADVPNVLSAGEYGFKVIWVKDGTGSKSLNELLACSKRCVSEVSSVFGVTDSKKSDINPSTNVTFKIRSAVATYGYDGLSAYERAVMLNITRESENVWLRTHATIEPGEGRW